MEILIPTGVWSPAMLVRVIDGDTILADCTTATPGPWRVPVRFAACNAPEKRGPTRAAGWAAKLWLQGWITPDLEVWPASHWTDKYGRLVAFVRRVPAGETGGGGPPPGRLVSDDLIAARQAVPLWRFPVSRPAGY